MNRLTTIILRFFSYLFNFGPRITYFYIIYPRYGGQKAILRRHEEIKRYLKRRYSCIIDKYRNVEVDIQNVSSDAPIWVCWLQGEEQMPDIAKKCYASVRKHAGNRPVHLIHEKNLLEWIQIPKFIQEKVKCGQLSYTHYADYIRILLLKEHGGLWIDATIWVTGSIKNDIGFPFFSIKQVPFSIHYVSESRWIVGVLSASKDNLLFKALEELFSTYLKTQSLFIDFFLFDYLISVLYEELPAVRDMIDNVSYTNPSFYSLIELLNAEYDNKKMEEILLDTSYHRLTWKQKFQCYTSDNKKTFWEVIKNT